MARKKTTEGGEVSAPTPTTSKRGGARGPRGIKLALPTDLQKQLDGLPGLYPDLKKADVQARFLDYLWPSLNDAYSGALNDLVNELENDRTAKVNALRGITPLAHEASMAPDESYAPIDDETAQ